MAIEKILVADDEPLIRRLLQGILEKEGYEISLAEDGVAALEQIKKESFEMVITDIRMPGMGGIELLEMVNQISPCTLVVAITAHGSIENAVEAMKKGAYDYLTKPITPHQIKLIIQRASRHKNLLEENKYLREEINEKYHFEELIGKSSQIESIYRMITRVASSKSTILIQGETGTGKELVARAIHYRSSCRNNPFIKVNCAALPSDLLESELFGHEQGAFTGAIKKKEGRFELANKGTLLLDEISETTTAFQVKLLRVLQKEGEFERVGGTKTIKADVRVIATTNQKLEKNVREGKFREDLYYRLNVIPIFLPSLRERKEDIPLLAHHFLRKYNRQNGVKIESISSQSLALMQDYNWPGNIRELENIIERAVVMTEGKVILPEYLSLKVSSEEEIISRSEKMTLEEMEKRLIENTLQKMGGNRTRTAEMLGVTARTIRNKIKKYYLN